MTKPDLNWQEPLHRFSVWMPREQWARVRAAVEEASTDEKRVTVAAWLRAAIEEALGG